MTVVSIRDGRTAAPRPSRRARALSTESAFDVLARARTLETTGRKVLHLEIGEPGVATPPYVVAAGVRALEAGRTGYAPPAGWAPLREAIAADLSARRIVASADRIVVTPGGKPALFLALQTIIEPGDEVLVPDPGFPIYPSAVRVAGGRPVPYALDRARSFGLDLDRIAALVTRHTRVLVLNLPSNPTGAAADRATLEAVAELAVRHRLLVVTDEVYAPFHYDGTPPSIAAIPGMAERTIVVDSFSKRFAMTGWRLGFACLPAPLVGAFTRYVINTFSCVPPFVQEAGLAALEGPSAWTAELVASLARRRDKLVRGLSAIPGIRCPVPAGAFFAFPEVPATIGDFAHRLLEEEGVAVLDGAGFGPSGSGFVRISFAAPDEVLDEAVLRIRRLAEVAP